MNIKYFNKVIHANACRLELEEVFKMEREFINEYANWLLELSRSGKDPESGYFGRAIHGFLDTIHGRELSPYEILADFKRRLDENFID